MDANERQRHMVRLRAKDNADTERRTQDYSELYMDIEQFLRESVNDLEKSAIPKYDSSRRALKARFPVLYENMDVNKTLARLVEDLENDDVLLEGLAGLYGDQKSFADPFENMLTYIKAHKNADGSFSYPTDIRILRKRFPVLYYVSPAMFGILKLRNPDIDMLEELLKRRRAVDQGGSTAYTRETRNVVTKWGENAISQNHRRLNPDGTPVVFEEKTPQECGLRKKTQSVGKK
jgi:hypothetical protein